MRNGTRTWADQDKGHITGSYICLLRRNPRRPLRPQHKPGYADHAAELRTHPFHIRSRRPGRSGILLLIQTRRGQAQHAGHLPYAGQHCNGGDIALVHKHFHRRYDGASFWRSHQHPNARSRSAGTPAGGAGQYRGSQQHGNGLRGRIPLRPYRNDPVRDISPQHHRKERQKNSGQHFRQHFRR